MAYVVLRPDDQRFEKPSWRQDDPARTLVELPLHAELNHCRPHLWRYPPGASGHRHRETVQEEIFLVVEGTLSMELGDGPERVDLPPRSLVVVEPGTALRVFNDSSDDVLVFAVGAPAEPGKAEILERAW